MSLRVKLVVALVALSAGAAVLIGAWSVRATASQLQGEVDRSLEAGARELLSRPQGIDRLLAEGAVMGPPGRPRPRIFDQVLVQVVDGGGTVLTAPASGQLPVGPDDLVLAAADDPGERTFTDVEDTSGNPWRMLTVSLGESVGAVQLARSLEETQRVVSSLATRTALAAGVVIVLAGAAGWLIARTVTRRLAQLTTAAEHVAATGRLDVGVPVGNAHDEAGRLGQAFNEMLGALARSREDQQRLVQDAGHELRTPLTSLRTNLTVLRRHPDLPGAERAAVLDALDLESRELTSLVNELVDLAADQRADEPVASVALGSLVERVVDRFRRRRGRVVHLHAGPDAGVVVAPPAAVARAVSNLLENAAKFDTSGSPIDVAVRAGRIEVADRGPGIDPEDLPRIFDRFYRSAAARSQPGSGLGLAIVRATAESHGGRVFAAARPGGGAVVGFELPLATPAGPSNPPLTEAGSPPYLPGASSSS